MPEPDTTQVETAAQVTPEPSAAPQAPGSEVTPEPAKADAPQAPEDVEALRKQLEKVQMEANLHKNKLKEFEQKEKDAERAQMSELERAQAELAEYRAKESRREAESFRNSVIDEYLANDPVALKAAKALIAKNPANLTWGSGADGNGATEDEARADVITQLDALKEVLGTENQAQPEAPAPTAPSHANNPGGNPNPVDPDRAALIAEATRTGDWTKVLGGMDSVKFQNSRVD